MIYLKKFEKNQIFPIFFSKLMLTICLRSQISQICTRKFQNWVYLCFGKVLKLKVTKGELIILNGLEMADAYLPGGWLQPPSPPALVRVELYKLVSNKTCYHFQQSSKKNPDKNYIMFESPIRNQLEFELSVHLVSKDI